MSVGDEFGLSGLAALGALGSVCAVMLRSTHHNLKSLDTLRREATAASEKLRQELRDHDETIFELQAMCADYRLAIAKLEDENRTLRTALLGSHSPFDPVPGESQEANGRRQHGAEQHPKSTAEKFKTRPEDVL